VLVRGELAGRLRGLEIVTTVGDTKLTSKLGLPIVSDHLPLFAEFSLEEREGSHD
jgi:hypothetical protein